ncbi:permease [Okeania sp. SIO2B9]|uniref:permease n=1 Tax=Okeania sp. SIO2B9 TaxID=2607782 RepID=UPI00257ED371|nr:permease [Okeania sp. SIO2B9]
MALEQVTRDVRGPERSMVLADFEAEHRRIDDVLTELIGPASVRSPEPSEPNKPAAPVVEEGITQLQLSWTAGRVVAWVRPLLQPKTARLLPRPQQSVSQKVETSPLLQSGTFFLGQSTTSMPLESIPLWQVEASTINQSPLGVSSQTTSNKDMSWKSLFVAPDRQRLLSLLNSMVQELQDLGGVLVIGSAIAAMIQVAAPREFILSLGQSPISSIIAMLTLAAVVSICSTVDAFFALSFAATFTSGSLLAFLVFGPMIDIKAVGLLLSVFRSRVVIYLMVLAAQLTFIMALIVNLYLS